MATRIDGSSLFNAMNSGLNNTFSILSTTFNDGVTLANLSKMMLQRHYPRMDLIKILSFSCRQIFLLLIKIMMVK